MTSWKIFRHAWRQLFGNFGAAIKVSLVPFLSGMLIFLAFIFGAGFLNATQYDTAFTLTSPGAVLMIIIGFVFLLLFAISIAVNWHRYILLAEQPRWWPRLHRGPILIYLGRAILIGLVWILPIGIFVVISRAISTNTAFGLGILGLGIFAIAVILILPLWLRLSASLPGAAIAGETIGKTWNATRGAYGTLMMLTLFLSFIGRLCAVPDLVVPQPHGPQTIFMFLWDIATGWFLAMLELSVLTTLYGYYVEKRDLV